MFKIKERTYEYFTTISIPGVPAIFASKSNLSKLVWTVLITGLLSVGAWNIYLAVVDYYNFDVITNIERVSPGNVTFPAITICTFPFLETIKRDSESNVEILKILKTFDFKNLIKRVTLWKKYEKRDDGIYIDVRNTLDFFSLSISFLGRYCLRYNGAWNKSIDLAKARFEADRFEIVLDKRYNVNISDDIYQWVASYFSVYVTDNFLNSFEENEPLILENDGNTNQVFEIEKPSIELKLPDPYNPCKEYSLGDEPYHKMNCIEACVYREIKNKHNCTFHETLFEIKGFKECVIDYLIIRSEFWDGCQKECPLESCFSEKLTYSFKSSYYITADNKIKSDSLFFLLKI